MLSPQVVKKVNPESKPPSRRLVDAYLAEIAASHGVDWCVCPACILVWMFSARLVFCVFSHAKLWDLAVLYFQDVGHKPTKLEVDCSTARKRARSRELRPT